MLQRGGVTLLLERLVHCLARVAISVAMAIGRFEAGESKLGEGHRRVPGRDALHQGAVLAGGLVLSRSS